MSPALKLFLVLIGIVIGVDLVFLNTTLVGFRRDKLGERLEVLENQLTNFKAQDEEATDAVTVMSGGDEEASVDDAAIVAPSSPQSISTQGSSVTREVFIPLGSASTFATDWVDTGAQVYIDTTVYADIREAYFQASLRSNSGVVYARLKQMNEKVAVPGSEISHAGGTATFVGSGEILLSPGNKLYAVQLRSQTGQEVFVENARVRMVLR